MYEHDFLKSSGGGWDKIWKKQFSGVLSHELNWEKNVQAKEDCCKDWLTFSLRK